MTVEQAEKGAIILNSIEKVEQKIQLAEEADEFFIDPYLVRSNQLTDPVRKVLLKDIKTAFLEHFNEEIEHLKAELTQL